MIILELIKSFKNVIFIHIKNLMKISEDNVWNVKNAENISILLFVIFWLLLIFFGYLSTPVFPVVP